MNTADFPHTDFPTLVAMNFSDAFIDGIILSESSGELKNTALNSVEVIEAVNNVQDSSHLIHKRFFKKTSLPIINILFYIMF